MGENGIFAHFWWVKMQTDQKWVKTERVFLLTKKRERKGKEERQDLNAA